tara:strand:+ start:420 stop:620 length:201 start_codon:yes stop_codon:yes gene_type:complete
VNPVDERLDLAGRCWCCKWNTTRRKRSRRRVVNMTRNDVVRWATATGAGRKKMPEEGEGGRPMVRV